MFGWFRTETACASWSRRSCPSLRAWNREPGILIATSRPRRASHAVDPAHAAGAHDSEDRIRPIRVPVASGIQVCLSVAQAGWAENLEHDFQTHLDIPRVIARAVDLAESSAIQAVTDIAGASVKFTAVNRMIEHIEELAP